MPGWPCLPAWTLERWVLSVGLGTKGWMMVGLPWCHSLEGRLWLIARALSVSTPQRCHSGGCFPFLSSWGLNLVVEEEAAFRFFPFTGICLFVALATPATFGVHKAEPLFKTQRIQGLNPFPQGGLLYRIADTLPYLFYIRLTENSFSNQTPPPWPTQPCQPSTSAASVERKDNTWAKVMQIGF